MKSLLWICTALMTMFVAGESLICNTCRVGLGPKCLFKSTETCSDPQFSCYKGKVDFNIIEWMTLHNRGCLSSSLCNQTVSGSLLGANYTITRDCCYTDLCNGASSVQLPLTAALGTALAASLSPWAL
ncbi:protein Bouncer-like [Archocentrus centrarchus]|uniref:protein Bouncer-like n=1 Tax=Archocentrus centrarchus TaxID=63155 RepID=UPI0011E9F7A1|nr:protein Bouncer-like [Archocentrus centrarchus]